METITVYKDSYNDLLDKEFEQMLALAELRGKVRALASIIDDNPKFVAEQLKELSAEIG